MNSSMLWAIYRYVPAQEQLGLPALLPADTFDLSRRLPSTSCGPFQTPPLVPVMLARFIGCVVFVGILGVTVLPGHIDYLHVTPASSWAHGPSQGHALTNGSPLSLPCHSHQQQPFFPGYEARRVPGLPGCPLRICPELNLVR